MQISSRAVMFWGCRWATRTFNSLQRFSMGLRSGDWLGHSRTLKCFLRRHSFVARAVCLGSLSCWKTQPRFIFNALADGSKVFTQNLTIHGPIHSFLYTDQSSWSLCRKTAPKHDVSTPMLHSRYGLLWMQLSILSPPNTTSWVFTKKFYFGFIWPYDILPILFWIIQMLSSKLQTGLDMYWLKQGTRLSLQDLSPWRRSALLMVAFVTLVPALCRSFTRSPRVVLGWDLAWSPRSREIISGLVCLPFSNNCSHSWFFHTKLLTYCRFSFPSLAQVYNFVSRVLWQLFGLGHSGVWSVTVWGCGQVSFILITSSNRCH